MFIFIEIADKAASAATAIKSIARDEGDILNVKLKLFARNRNSTKSAILNEIKTAHNKLF